MILINKTAARQLPCQNYYTFFQTFVNSLQIHLFNESAISNWMSLNLVLSYPSSNTQTLTSFLYFLNFNSHTSRTINT